MKQFFCLLSLIPSLVFSQSEQSWTEIANEFYKNESYEKAIVYYKKWAEASPKDSNNWYNLACTYSLTKQKNESIDALKKAIKYGFNDCKHIKKDTDLAFVSELEEFNFLLEECNNIQNQQSIPKRIKNLVKKDVQITVLHGDKDKLVKLEKSKSLIASFVENKVKANLIIVESGHSINENVKKEVLNFIAKNRSN